MVVPIIIIWVSTLSFLESSRVILNFIVLILMKILLANRLASDGMPRSVVSRHGLYCFPMPRGQKGQQANYII